jgi:hypothetical protein
MHGAAVVDVQVRRVGGDLPGLLQGAGLACQGGITLGGENARLGALHFHDGAGVGGQLGLLRCLLPGAGQGGIPLYGAQSLQFRGLGLGVQGGGQGGFQPGDVAGDGGGDGVALGGRQPVR